MKKRVLILELNEFNLRVMQKAAQELDLVNLNKLLANNKYRYLTDDKVQFEWLDPWVQWVSVHTGLPSSEHKIQHLGEVPDHDAEQFWELLSKRGVTTGVWGVMNGNRRNAENNLFFIPDPWTYSEKAYPVELNRLLNLPRHLSQNYLNVSIKQLIAGVFEFGSFLVHRGVFWTSIWETVKLFPVIMTEWPKHYTLISLFDYLSCYIFLKYKKKYKPDISLIFLNSIAHVQHHHWNQGPDTLTKPLQLTFKNLDRIVGLLYESLEEGEAFIVHNALTQINTNHEKPWILYRQNDPVTFMKEIGFPSLRIEQLMTNDAHVFFKNKHERDNAFKALSEARCLGKSIFNIEKSKSNNQLFYRLDFTEEVEKDVAFIVDGRSYRFFDLFSYIVTRTGRHIAEGDIVSDQVKFDDDIYNHEFNDYVYKYLFES
jgi:hypothetical protein